MPSSPDALAAWARSYRDAARAALLPPCAARRTAARTGTRGA
ncbi:MULTISPECIES: hypothetical protein [unclassified Streptomyces]|nr:MULTISPECIES: hypothetical protein [unclassified Streptomyces]WPO75636.1 hypothetical protein R9806_36095 [Streptomyces sp. KN37]